MQSMTHPIVLVDPKTKAIMCYSLSKQNNIPVFYFTHTKAKHTHPYPVYTHTSHHTTPLPSSSPFSATINDRRAKQASFFSFLLKPKHKQISSPILRFYSKSIIFSILVELYSSVEEFLGFDDSFSCVVVIIIYLAWFGFVNLLILLPCCCCSSPPEVAAAPPLSPAVLILPCLFSCV